MSTVGLIQINWISDSFQLISFEKRRAPLGCPFFMRAYPRQGCGVRKLAQASRLCARPITGWKRWKPMPLFNNSRSYFVLCNLLARVASIPKPLPP